MKPETTILDYALNEKFEIEYYMVNTFYSKKSVAEIELGNLDSNINPETDFKIYIGINYELNQYETPDQNVILKVVLYLKKVIKRAELIIIYQNRTI